MAKAAWQGYITLGQLGIPVRLYSATQSLRPRFVQLHEKDSSPVERVLRCRDEQQEISLQEVIRAVEYEPGRYVTLADSELEQAAVGPIKAVDIKQFCDPGAVEPIYFEKPFYVVPARGGERAYALLREVFARSRKIAITELVIYNKERIAALGVQGDLLMLHQLRFAAEIVPRANVKTPALPKPSPDEIDALSSVVARLSSPFYAQDYHDEHTEQINRLIEHKIRNLPMPRRERIAPHTTPEGKIVTVLRETLERPTNITSRVTTEK